MNLIHFINCAYLILVLGVMPAIGSLRKLCENINLNSECQCEMRDNFEITCPGKVPNPLISLQVSTADKHVLLICDHIDLKDYKNLPRKMPLENIQHVQMKDCPLPGNKSFARLFRNLGITQLRSFIFKNDNLKTNFTRNHLTGFQGLQLLSLSSNNIFVVPAEFFASMKSLRVLELRSKNLKLKPSMFSRLTNLEFLELGHNNITELPVGVFRKLNNLTDLNLWGNRLRNLSKDVFRGIPSIVSLDLSANDIETLPPNVFSTVTNLTHLNLSFNRFTKLPKNLFVNNKKLTQFRLLHNRVPLETLPPALLANLPELKEIKLKNCLLKSISGNIFKNSTAITNITLADNELGNLPERLFIDQYRLVHLDLSNNRLTELPAGLFKRTVELAVLQLSHNDLTTIDNNIFATLTNLKELHIDNNRLISISDKAFFHARNLYYINMDNNRLDMSLTNGAFSDDLPKLKTLNLRNNSISHISGDWLFQLIELRELNLQGNNITSLDTNILRYKHDMSINLADNKIASINFKYIDELLLTEKHNNNLQLNFNGNPLDCDCQLLDFVEFIQGDLSAVFQQTIKLNISSLTCATPDNLRGQRVREISPRELLCSYHNSESAQWRCPRGCACWERTSDSTLIINCANNNLTEVPALPTSSSFPQLELHLENNDILQLPQAHETSYENVTKLLLAGNKLTQLDVRNLPKRLKHLDLQRNQLKYLNSNSLKYLTEKRTLTALLLSENPWQCDCDALELLAFTQVNYKLISDYANLYCADQRITEGFGTLTPSKICPTKIESTIVKIAMIFIISSFIGTMAVLCSCKCQQKTTILLRKKKEFNMIERNESNDILNV